MYLTDKVCIGRGMYMVNYLGYSDNDRTQLALVALSTVMKDNPSCIVVDNKTSILPNSDMISGCIIIKDNTIN